MTLKTLLFADLARQYSLAGQPEKRPNMFSLMKAFFSPRFMPIVIFRLSHWLYQHKLSPLAKILSLINFVFFGLEIAVRCEIGGGLYFPHTQGTVIGAHKIGINATIYHNVTFGAREIDLDYSETSRPTVGDNVIVGAGAKVLGTLHLGDNSRVGANAVVLESVPNGATVIGIPASIIKQSNEL
ncbi:MAG: serine acetyltransferase [Candidatus Saccharibacteria bacterium]|nr:serine acetyltransferase [Moraxellaceae bacterium]